MKLWISGETWGDKIDKGFRVALNTIEDTVNKKISTKDYGKGLKSWDYIAIILPKDYHEDYPEIYKYSKRTKETEFRLFIDYKKFKKANQHKKITLMCQSSLRSLKMLPELGLKDCDLEQLKQDFLMVCKEHKWL